MCERTNTPPTLACTIGDLHAGAAYHDPNGDTCLVTFQPRTPDSTIVVNLRTGQITPVYSDTKLGRDERGLLYTSRFLNEWYFGPSPAAADDDGAVGPVGPDQATVS